MIQNRNDRISIKGGPRSDRRPKSNRPQGQQPPKGHHADLKRYQQEKTPLTIVSINGDVVSDFTIVDFDSYTIKLTGKSDDGNSITISTVFKHAIVSINEFKPVEPTS